MTIKEILESLENGKIVTSEDYENRILTTGFVGDLLSVVMGKAEEDCAWITIQSHMNIVAVGTLVNVGCIIVTEGFAVDQDAITKANEEDITIITTTLSSFEAAAVLVKMGFK